MNILVLVSSFLLILSFVSATVVKKVIAFESEKKSFVGFMQGTRATRNMWENKKFVDATQGLESPISFSSLKQAVKTSTKEFSSHRTKKKLPHLAKLNISPLFKKETSSPLLYQTAAHLLKNLYGRCLFVSAYKEEKWEYELLDELIKLATPLSSPAFIELYPEQQQLHDIFYKMLKGTGDYDIASHKGYPPLTDFFMIDEKEKKPIYFCYASAPLLSALFGSEIAEEILELEKEKAEKDFQYHTLLKGELQTLLLQKGSHEKNGNVFEELLNFSKKKATLSHLSHKDKGSGVCISLPLPVTSFKNVQ